ncbi:hypothetical protein ACFQU9_30055 [Actinomadura namibiensis]|uniref:Lipoprotein n=1 Tax=Actinomadura namibiensis TaxID=182080 RepID=A0A7W3LJ43_ACTNM|nr:hypothetical protein [Actinomadura namibiensis]MBA8949126.1 hypothetical protein [Actinomadura namibiensis]
MTPRESTFRRRVLVAVAVLALTGCGPTDTSPPDASARKKTPSAPTLPKAADGTDLKACADGRCEVQVDAPADLPVPRKLQVASVRVQSVGPDTVTLVGRPLGSRTGGFCTGVKCSSSSAGGKFTLTLGPASTGSQNDLKVTVVAVNGGSAVLRLAPAS